MYDYDGILKNKQNVINDLSNANIVTKINESLFVRAD